MVVTLYGILEAQPDKISAQLAELIALTRTLAKGRRVTIYKDSKYALLVLHACPELFGENELILPLEIAPLSMPLKLITS